MSSRNSHSQFCSSPPLLSSQEAPNATGNGDAPRRDAAAAVAAAGSLNEHNAHQHSALNLDSPPSPKLTSAETPAGSTSVSTPKRERAGTLCSNLDQIQFRSHTIAPSPTLPRFTSASTPPRPAASVDSNLHSSPRGRQNLHSPSGHGLRLQTEINPIVNPFSTATGDSSNYSGTLSSSPTLIRSSRPSLTLHHKSSASSLRPISRTPSLRAGSLPNPFSPISATSSCYPSPVIAAMGDVTPLPSPLLPSDSPGPWKKLGYPKARETIPESHPGENTPFPNTESSNSTSAMVLPKKKSYAGLASGRSGAANDGEHLHTPTTSASHTRNRSISEYIPEPMHIPKRMSTISGTRVRPELKNVEPGYDGHMRREPHLSEARGLAPPIEKPPTPPPSEASMSVNDVSSLSAFGLPNKESYHEYFEAYGKHDRKLRRWRAIKMLGQGTFSRVMLATSQIAPSDDEDCSPATGMHTPEPTYQHDRRTLVAVKVCEHGPRGGASEDRIEMSLKRELELMRVLHHPSLVQLKAWNIEMTRAILVLSYCPGGDLFDIASRHRDVLSPTLLRRIFSEVVGAVSYLHSEKIVHRDIKLENVLVNLTPEELSKPTDWATYPYSVITLTDLGLSRRVADDEKLETRCGSDDYAAPEVIMGQPYDGRATDAWSLGVLLYALLEGRLPFDPPPGAGDHAMQMRMRSRTSHRIARVEWRWIIFGVPNGEDGEGKHEADPAKFSAKGLQGAREVVEGLLRRARTRWPLTQAAATEWVSGGIQVEGGIRFREEDDGEEVTH